jgi:hypothetical protein
MVMFESGGAQRLLSGRSAAVGAKQKTDETGRSFSFNIKLINGRLLFLQKRSIIIS